MPRLSGLDQDRNGRSTVDGTKGRSRRIEMNNMQVVDWVIANSQATIPDGSVNEL